jgi:hypothetical protein
MSATLAHLELLAEVDSLVAELTTWVDSAPPWPPGRACQALVRRLIERADTLRVRLEAPLVVATLGGTGTGKSSLVNALVGEEVTAPGRERPTTRKPILICRPDLTPQQLGIDPSSVQLVQRGLPALRDLVLLDCPDPDTTEDEREPLTNLARLRELLPHCDVLLVTSTQQKYRSSRVRDELAAAAPGARLVFVQTHAAVDEDIRPDWRKQLAAEYDPGELFFVDSLAALADAQAGVAPRGDFARLVDLLTHELAGAAAHRIRRVNFLDLAQQTLAHCREKIAAGREAVERLDAVLLEQRTQLAATLAANARDDLLANRRHWENRLLGEVCARWGLSPFALVLRAFHGLGSLIAGATLLRMRTPAQLAIWGVAEGARRLRTHRERQLAEATAVRKNSWVWDEPELRSAGLIVAGYAGEAGLPRDDLQGQPLTDTAGQCGEEFVATAARDVQASIGRLAHRHTGWFTRGRYELALLILVGLLLFRLGKNFFYDNWLGPDLFGQPRPSGGVDGLDFFVQAGFWLVLWCLLLVWLFTGRLRRGLRGEVGELAARWSSPDVASGLFEQLQGQCQAVRRFDEECQRLETAIAALRQRLELPEPRLGRRVA